MMTMKRQNKLGSYLAVTIGAGCAASVAEGAVTFYGINSANDTSSDPAGIKVGVLNSGYRNADGDGTSASYFMGGNGYWSRGADLASFGDALRNGSYWKDGFIYGAVAGRENYANISFDGHDNIFEAVGQFYFDGAGGGYLIAIATTNPVINPQDLSGVGGPALSISAGKAMIVAAIPEPSSLALLALGSAGLITRRQRKKAA
jgi:hypothetical protein